jgi:hypothetical protein
MKMKRNLQNQLPLVVKEKNSQINSILANEHLKHTITHAEYLIKKTISK